jgi:putative colanic acid biosynthesis acetyltransferase WcaF
MLNMLIQDLSRFSLPVGFRGRNAFVVQLWWIVHSSIFRLSPQFAYRFRTLLLRWFGAKIGENVLIRPTVCVTYPWNVSIGDNSWIGDDVVIYSLGKVCIGSNSVVSHRSYLCAGDHDYRRVDFPIRARDVIIGNQCWIGLDVYVGPGVSIGDMTVVGARSSVYRDLPSKTVCVGSPCCAIKTRGSVAE